MNHRVTPRNPPCLTAGETGSQNGSFCVRKNCFLMEGEPGGRSDATSGLTPRNGRARKGDQPLFAASHHSSLLFSTTFLNNPASYRAVQQRIRRVSTRSLQIHRRLRRPTEPSFSLSLPRPQSLPGLLLAMERIDGAALPSDEVPTSTPTFATSSTHGASVIHPLRGESMTLVEGKIFFFILRSSSSLCH